MSESLELGDSILQALERNEHLFVHISIGSYGRVGLCWHVAHADQKHLNFNKEKFYMKTKLKPQIRIPQQVILWLMETEGHVHVTMNQKKVIEWKGCMHDEYRGPPTNINVNH